MRRLTIRNLFPTARLLNALYHSSGELLHKAGARLSAQDISAMQDCGIEHVMEVETSHEAEQWEARRTLEPVDLFAVREGRVFPTSVLNGQGRLLLPAGTPFTEELRQRLLGGGMLEVYVPKPPGAAVHESVRRYRDRLARPAGPTPREVRAVEELTADLQAAAAIAAVPPEGPPAERGTKLLGRRDRRRHARYPAALDVDFQVQVRMSSIWDPKPRRGRVQNISGGGLSLVTEEPLTRGTKIKMTMALRPGQVELETLLEVMRVHSHGKRCEAGARFLFVGAARKKPPAPARTP